MEQQVPYELFATDASRTPELVDSLLVQSAFGPVDPIDPLRLKNSVDLSVNGVTTVGEPSNPVFKLVAPESPMPKLVPVPDNNVDTQEFSETDIEGFFSEINSAPPPKKHVTFAHFQVPTRPTAPSKLLDEESITNLLGELEADDPPPYDQEQEPLTLEKLENNIATIDDTTVDIQDRVKDLTTEVKSMAALLEETSDIVVTVKTQNAAIVDEVQSIKEQLQLMQDDIELILRLLQGKLD